MNKEKFLEGIEPYKLSNIKWITYWSQPFHGKTIEKFEKFEKFSNKENLLKELEKVRETDASSLPSGGLRGTHYAKGYNKVDWTSRLFLDGDNLYVPSTYYSIDGSVLDYKIPLLRSIERLSNIATKVFEMVSGEDSKVYPSVGLEQEFFLIPETKFKKRKDLVYTGRTLFGNLPPKHQQMEDHYFGNISKSINLFFENFTNKCDKFNIDITTKHLEVAPCQYEIAQNYKGANEAVDTNLFIRKLLHETASMFYYSLLLHEKPFEGINGSGKHMNWSLMTENGLNLLDYKNNRWLFTIFFVNVIAAVDQYEELLRASVASYSNDMRLGANEAPPSIISVYTGEYLANPDILFSGNINFDTERNRTSPFPFNENKFEFRAVGSSQNPSFPITCLNIAVAYQLETFYDSLNSDHSTENIKNKLIEIFDKSKRIIYNDDCYNPKWAEIANERGLSNIPNATDAIECLKNEKTIQLFDGIMNKKELHALYEIKLDEYLNNLRIEINTINELINDSNNSKLIKKKMKFNFDDDDIYNIDIYKNYLLDMKNKLNKLEWNTKSKNWKIPKLSDILKTETY